MQLLILSEIAVGSRIRRLEWLEHDEVSARGTREAHDKQEEQHGSPDSQGDVLPQDHALWNVQEFGRD
jgi:hypothetical protein